MLFLTPIVWMPLSVVVGFHRAAVVANESPLCGRVACYQGGNKKGCAPKDCLGSRKKLICYQEENRKEVQQ